MPASTFMCDSSLPIHSTHSVDASDARYVYQPIKGPYAVLVTNNSRNTLQDIGGLHRARTTLLAAFAFEGFMYREGVNIMQVRLSRASRAWGVGVDLSL